MTNIGLVVDQDELVLTKGRDFKWSFDNTDESGGLVNYPAGDLYFELHTGGAHNAIQQVDIIGAEDGHYTLAYNGVASASIDYYDATTTPYDLTLNVKSALEGIAAIGAGNVAVTRTALTPVWNLNIALTGTSQNEIQELSITSLISWLGLAGHSNGQMILSYRDNDAASPIPFDATAADIQASLETIPQIGVGNVTVTKPSSSVAKYNIEYKGILATRDVDLIHVRAYQAPADFFGNLLGPFLTTITTRTIQNGRKAVLDGRMIAALTAKVTDFFALFDPNLSITVEFVITDSTHFTIVCRTQKAYTEVDLVTFDVLFTGTTVKTFFNNQVVLNGAVSTVTVDQYWNHQYTVEFINARANRPHPLLVGNAAGLTTAVTAVPIVPKVQTQILDRGQSDITVWDFVIAGSSASLKVESEDVDLIENRTRWQLVFKLNSEPAGGDPVSRGVTKVQE